MLAGIRGGGTPWVAAAAVGMGNNAFLRRMEQDPEFRRKVEEAQGQARLRMELRVSAVDPVRWLTKGPGGRGKLGREGWTDRSTVEVTGANGGAIEVAPIDLSRLSYAELVQYQALNKKLIAPAVTEPAQDSKP